jgi:ABC-type branched-subunit amino acid transport system ATPase component/branched-subunit amino acid ABC-type transport system permease component
VAAILIAALVTGSVYGLIGTGLVLTYDTSGIFNFAYGAMASVGVYLYFALRGQHNLPLAVCLPICLIVLPFVMGRLLEPFAQKLTQQHLTLQVAGTIGLLLVIEAVAELAFGVNTQYVPTFLPANEVTILGTKVGVSQIITFIFSVIAVVLLNVLLRRTRRGIEMRAVVDNSDLLALSGGKPSATRRLAWTISSFLVVLSGLLIAPSIGIDPQDLTSLAILAFAAAAFGGFKNTNIAYLGGFLVAVPEVLLARYINSSSILGSLSQNLPFLLLVIIILAYPKRAFLRAKLFEPRRRLHGTRHLPRNAEIVLGVCVLAFLIAVPAFAGFRISAWTESIAILVLLLSLGLLVRISGQVCLCQMAFAAIGVSAFAALTNHAHLPWLIALLIAGLAPIPFALVLAIPALRLSGLYLALGTFGFGYAILNMFYQTNLMFGPGEAGLAIPTPAALFNFLNPNDLYYLLLVFALVATAVVVGLERTRAGRLLHGMADSRVGLETLGTSVGSLQMLIFALSAFVGGIAGVLIGVAYGAVSGTSYWPDTSLLYFVVLVIIVGRAPWFALVAALGVAVLPTFYQGNFNYYLQIVFGASAILVGVGFQLKTPPAVAQMLRLVGTRVRGRPAAEAEGPPEDLATVVEAAAPAAAEGGAAVRRKGGERTREGAGALEVTDVVVAFGGLVAVNQVSLEAPLGQITGLIGPNGAGKTTLFNVCSGLQQQKTGTVRYAGQEISHQSPSWRARHGLGRTFQQMELFDSMTVEQNVRLGREARLAGIRPTHLVWSRRGQRHDIDGKAENAMEICGLERISNRTVADLSTGDRRLVELARCIAADFDLLLLDEPSSGLDSAESHRFGAALQNLVSQQGTGILLIEHDIELVVRVCEYIHVLDFGKKIFEGPPAEVRRSREVQAAYLGVVEEPV